MGGISLKYIKKIVKEEKGQSAVIFAFVFIVLIGMMSFVIDLGNINSQKSDLQNAADAAALASVQELPDIANACAAAGEYAAANGIDTASGDVLTVNTSYGGDSSKIEIICTREIDYIFAQVWGLKKQNVKVRAVAVSGGTGTSAFNYALFSGSSDDPISFKSCSADIVGSVHTNNIFKAENCSIKISDICEAVKGIDIPKWMRLGTQSNNPAAQYIPMPDFSEQIKAQAQESGTVYNTSKTFNKNSFNVNTPIYVDGDLTVTNCSFSGSGWLFATGNITVKSCSFKQTSGQALCIYSQNGNVTFTNASLKISGIVYAPKGTVDISSVSVDCEGSIVANIIKIGNNSTKVKHSSDMLSNLPAIGSPSLVE